MLNKIKKYIYIWIFSMFISISSFGFAQDQRFNDILNTTTDEIKQNVAYDVTQYRGANQLSNFIIDFVVKYIMPVFLIIAVMVAIFGFYKLMMSNKDGDEKKWVDYIIWWVVWIIVMQSATFIGTTLTSTITALDSSSNLNTIPEVLYNSIVFPFLQMFMYIIIGTLFVILLIHVIRFITTADEKTATHSKNIIVNNVIGVVVIMLSKEIVQAIYGKQSDVNKTATDLGDIGTWFLTNINIKIIYDIINRVMSIIWFMILAIIIYQSYQLLMNPTDDKQIWAIKKNFGYIFFWMVMIWFCYLIVNFLLVN